MAVLVLSAFDDIFEFMQIIGFESYPFILLLFIGPSFQRMTNGRLNYRKKKKTPSNYGDI